MSKKKKERDSFEELKTLALLLQGIGALLAGIATLIVALK